MTRDEYMDAHAADRLIAAIDRAGSPICVGIDPVLDRLPREFASLDPASAIEQFSCAVVDSVVGIAPCVKIQSACFERYGPEGAAALDRVLAHARSVSGDGHLCVILDAKRGDIGISAEHYAAAIFDRSPKTAPDFVTINGYLGEDGIRPFLRPGRGAFVLVRTSNPGGDPVQAARLDDGRTVAEAFAGLVHSIGESHRGETGYSALGAVVGATKPAEIESLRERMPHQYFLVPGYGAQRASAGDIAKCFTKDGRGAIVSASRSVIYAFEQDSDDWRASIRSAAIRFAEEITRAKPQA